MNKPLLHVLGGGQWQVPTIRLAKSMGLRVLVTDMYPDRPGYHDADYFEVVDITDMEASLDIAKRYGISGVICDTTDVGVPTAAYIAEQLHLPGLSYDVALNFTNKWRMREVARGLGMASPDYFMVGEDDLQNYLNLSINYPAVAKPIDSQSGKGVSIVDSEAFAFSALQYAIDNSKSGKAIIESLVPGQEIIVDSFMLDGNATILGLAMKTRSRIEPTVSERITYTLATEFDKDTLAAVADTNQRLLSAMGLRWGIAHCEYIINDEDVIPIDISARGGGCMIYTHILPFISGTNANREMIKLAIGTMPEINKANPRAGNIEFFHLPNGILREWHGLSEVFSSPGVISIHFNIKPGDEVPALRNKDHRAGYILTGGTTSRDAIEYGLKAKSKLKARMQDSSTEVEVI